MLRIVSHLKLQHKGKFIISCPATFHKARVVGTGKVATAP